MDWTQVILSIVGGIVSISTVYVAYLQTRAKFDAEEANRLRALADVQSIKATKEVAEKVHEAKEDLKVYQDQATRKADKLLEVTDKVHILVNSNMGIQLTLNKELSRWKAEQLKAVLSKDPGNNILKEQYDQALKAANLADEMLRQHEDKQRSVDEKTSSK